MKKLLAALLTVPVLLSYGALSADAFEHRIQAGAGQYTIDYVEPFFSASVKPFGAYAAWVGVLNDYISFDARLGGSGSKTHASGLRLNAGGLSAFFRPMVPVADGFEVYGLLGASSIALGRSGPGLIQQTVAKAGLSYGVGLDVRIADHFSIGAEWVKYLQDVNFAAAGIPAINVSVTGLSATFAYHF